jgi:hypothetical protein
MRIRGKPFKPGDPRAGRKVGQVNQRTIEARTLCMGIISSPAGIARLQAKYDRGTLHPSVVQMLWHYAVGKPKETVKVEGGLETLRISIARDVVRAALEPLPVLGPGVIEDDTPDDTTDDGSEGGAA